jgi:6-phosphogluconolactonase (cycloisomerase 2 family)
MVERLLILKDDLNNEINKTDRLIKAQSFNTDDDDSLTAGDLQQIEEDNTSKSNDNLLRVDESKRTLLSLNSPSFDSIIDPEGSISDIPISEKSKKKKRRTMEKIVIQQRYK